jgi:citrate synthase
MHPMTQFSMGVMTCQPDSHFVKAYSSGVHKSKYWVSTLEDALDVCAKVSRIATLVYHNSFKNTANIPNSDPSLDYGANFA